VNLEDKILFSSSSSSNEKDDLTIKEEEEQQQEEKQEVPATTLERVILLRITHIFQIINITSFSFSHYFLYLSSHKG
jgi:cell division ATPase FtsA